MSTAEILAMSRDAALALIGLLIVVAILAVLFLLREGLGDPKLGKTNDEGRGGRHLDGVQQAGETRHGRVWRGLRRWEGVGVFIRVQRETERRREQR